MRAVDIIVQEITEQGITQQKAADLCGFTRQRLWDVLDKRNPRFQTMEKIMTGLGYRMILIDKETMCPRTLDEADELVRVCSEENIQYDSVVRIMDTVGIILDIVKNA